MNRLYETLLLIGPEPGEEQRKALVDNLVSILVREGAFRVDIDDWGSKELAYAVRKQTRGYYVRLEYVAPGNAVAEMERIIRITDDIFKFITVKLDHDYDRTMAKKAAAGETAAPAPTPDQPAPQAPEEETAATEVED